jgi:hypothetical protein
MRFSAPIGIAASLILCAFQADAANECAVKSGAYTTPLLELYTSEGCSSCPPADEWLSGLKGKNLNVTALAFHVDYWDYIGWKDHFAMLAYSERQRKTAALNGSSFVYTPQFVFNGRDFRSWGDARLQTLLDRSQQQPARADLSLRMIRQADGGTMLWANAQMAAADTQPADVYVVIFENGLSSKIQAGENNGRILRHDYVVRQLLGAYPLAQVAMNKGFTLSPEWEKRDAGAVIFVQNRTSGEIIQSLQLRFCH